jgi:hypothetical protein
MHEGWLFPHLLTYSSISLKLAILNLKMPQDGGAAEWPAPPPGEYWLRSSGANRCDRAEQPMLLVINTGGKEERICGPGGAPISEAQGPESVNLYRPAVRIIQEAEKASGLEIKLGDLSAPKLTHQ